jgi:hypothetical protein
MLGILLVFAILYFSGAMNIVINRILEGVAVGDLSTSRNTALERLLANGEISFKPLSGHVINYNYSSMISALEYPFLRWAYTNGIVFSAVMYFMYFIVPGLRVLRTKNWNELICVLILMAFVNGNNGISAYNDDLLIYSINIGLILQYISYEKRWTIWGKIK